MREEVGKFYKETIEVTAKFKSYAVTSGLRNNLFVHVEKNGVELTGHVWLRLPKDIEKNLKKKKKYTFTAEVAKYYKGKKEDEEKKMDYCLVNCRNFVEVVEEKVEK